MKHQWVKLDDGVWECSRCGVEGAAYDPDDVIKSPCPGRKD